MILLSSIPGGFIMAGQLILSLTILVFVHEMGHFLAAKAFGIRVEKFYIFFDAWGKKLFSFKKGGTEYGLGWLPLGGYVKIAGMIDESMDKDALSKEPEPWEFRSKPAWQRFIVMIGGIVMNIILGILIYSMWLNHYKGEYLPVSELKTGIYAHALGEEMGFQTGDKILSVNGKTPERFDDVKPLKIYFGGEIMVDRDGETKTIQLPGNLFKRINEDLISPAEETVVVAQVLKGRNAEKAGLQEQDKILVINGVEYKNFPELSQTLKNNKNKEIVLTIKRGEDIQKINAQVDTGGMLGFAPTFDYSEKYDLAPYHAGDALKYGSREAFSTIIVNAIGFSKIFSGDIDPRDSVQSPIGIAKFFGATWNWNRFWYLTAMISMVLAFMNILPIPALDGGHMVFLLIEMVTRKPVSEKILERAQIVGMMILLTLMVLVMGNDIAKLIGI